MTSAWDGLAKSEAILVAVIEENVPELVAARKAIGGRHIKRAQIDANA
jgi:hypothetical protein